MKTTVDADLCIGCELCAGSVPEVYTMEGDISIAITDEVDPSLEDDVRTAMDDCPVDAISID